MRKLLSLALALTLILSLAMVAPAAAEGDVVQLTWAMGCSADAPTDAAIVGAALNAITREKLGCEVEIVYLTNDRLLTALEAGEIYDMYFTCDWYNDYVTQTNKGFFADITEAVQTVTPDLYATMPEVVWEGAKIDGKIYAIPVNKDYCPEIFLRFPKDFFVEIGMEIPYDIEFTEIEPYLAAWKEAHPDGYPLLFASYPGGLDGIFNFLNRDALIGIPYNKVGTDEGTKVISVFEDEEMLARFAAMHEWYNKGYINPDIATTTAVDDKTQSIKTGQGFYGADSIWSAATGYAEQIARISGPYLSASGVRGSMNAIDATLVDQPERFEMALKYQELVNTDLEYRDMLRYGIEGTHFNYNEDGTVTKTAEGVSNYSPWAFSQGSYALSSVEASTSANVKVDPNMWKKIAEIYANEAIVAADFGFSFNPTEYEMEIANIKVVKDKWLNLIYSGTIEPVEACGQAIAEMEAVGLRDVIAGAQAQLDAFLAAK